MIKYSIFSDEIVLKHLSYPSGLGLGIDADGNSC